MKKLFLFTVALLTSLMVGATSYVVDATASANDNIRRVIDHGHSIQVADGDTLYLQDATYIEGSSELEFTNNLVILPLEGAKPTIQLTIPMKIMGAGLTVKGVKFTNSYVRVYSGASGSVVFDGCSFEDMSDYAILMDKADVQLEALTFNNCLFKNVTKNTINNSQRGATAPGITKALTVTNSSFINCSNTSEAWTIFMQDNDGDNATPGPECLIDHCTFYDCSHKESSTFMVYLYHIVEATISNCVASHSENQPNTESFTAYQLKEADVVTKASVANNCIYYNCTGANWQMTKTNVTKADPLFADPANGDFNFAFTSPLFLAATDGTHIGDPRWGVEVGENAVNVPDTLPNAEALLTGEDMKLEEGDILFWDDLGNPGLSYASWVVNAQKVGDYDVYVKEVSGDKGHQYQFSIANQTAWLAKEAEPEYNHRQGDIKIGTFTINEKGYHLFQLNNIGQWSSGRVEYVMLRYRGGAQMAVPCFLPADEAMLYGPKIVQKDEGIAWGNNENIEEDYAVWNINVTKAGVYVVTMNVSKANGSGHTFSIDVYDSNNQQVGTTIAEPSGEITMAVGTYTVRLNNATKWSSAIMESVSFMRKGGDVVDVPGILPAEDALLSGNIIRLENGSVKWPNKSDVENHYVTWNVTAAAAGEVDVTLHVGTPSSGHCFTVGLYEGETLKASISEDATAHSTGTLLLGSITIPAAGSYTIRLNNAVSWSSAIVDSIKLSTAVAPTVITIEDDTEIDFTAYEGQIVTVQLNRTFKANMYNPICLPFAVSDELFQQIFKSPKSFVLNKATLENQKLFVELAENYGIYQGTPVMVKPTEDVVDPIFENVQIKATSPNQTTEGVLRLQGSFASHIIDNPQNALLVGANNTLFFPNDETTPYIKSMRAYFILVEQAAGAPIKAACFREPGNAPTWIPIVGAETEKPNGKFIRDGRFVIVREGKEYNAQGIEL